MGKSSLQTTHICQFVPVSAPPLKAWTVHEKNSSPGSPLLSVESRIVLPPVEWARENDYEWCAYSFEFGRVGIYARSRLFKMNSNTLERDVIYDATLQRIPLSSRLGRYAEECCGTVWVVPAQPWRSSSSGYQSLSDSSCSNNVSLIYFSEHFVQQPSAYTEAAAISELASSAPSEPQVVFIGVVVVREPQYSIIWSRTHGFVVVSATCDLVLAAADWVKYYCIPFDTEVGVKYMALYCDKYEKTPLASEPHGKSIICHTIIHLPHGQKKVVDSTRNTNFVMDCDILGDVLVPDIALVNSCIKKGFLKAQVQISFDLNNDWPCRLFAVIANGSVKQIMPRRNLIHQHQRSNRMKPGVSIVALNRKQLLMSTAEKCLRFIEDQKRK
ncbi:unnamed protein product [Gongylonema pulchrum]|uniref:Uncharacterized protein n=1 Tax=Gongylonema pulchrum TaxID=637853 RepID=A0A3P7QAB5_9BILA|nr:unnamed protein product [Gongylonema pulchrum]